jgi:hypothetical protein
MVTNRKAHSRPTMHRCTCFISKVLLWIIIRKFDSRNKLSYFHLRHNKLHTPLGTNIHERPNKSAFYSVALGETVRRFVQFTSWPRKIRCRKENIFIMRLPCSANEIKNVSEGETRKEREKQIKNDSKLRHQHPIWDKPLFLYSFNVGAGLDLFSFCRIFQFSQADCVSRPLRIINVRAYIIIINPKTKTQARSWPLERYENEWEANKSHLKTVCWVVLPSISQ